MKTIYKIILPILTLILTISAVVIGSVALSEVYGDEDKCVFQIGINELFIYDATEMFVDSEYNPNIKGIFTDKDLLSEVKGKLCDILQFETYKNTKKPKKSSAPGSGEFPCISFLVNNNNYGFSVVEDDKLEISINGIVSFYHTKFSSNIKNLINETINFLFFDELK